MSLKIGVGRIEQTNLGNVCRLLSLKRNLIQELDPVRKVHFYMGEIKKITNLISVI